MFSYNIPLVADIHFAPPIAMRVAECFDKIRVNPGNFGMIPFLCLLVLLPTPLSYGFSFHPKVMMVIFCS